MSETESTRKKHEDIGFCVEQVEKAYQAGFYDAWRSGLATFPSLAVVGSRPGR